MEDEGTLLVYVSDVNERPVMPAQGVRVVKENQSPGSLVLAYATLFLSILLPIAHAQVRCMWQVGSPLTATDEDDSSEPFGILSFRITCINLLSLFSFVPHLLQR